MDEKPRLTADRIPQEIYKILGPVRCLDYPSQGETSEVVFVESAHGFFVVKRAHQPPYVDWLRREDYALRALAATGLPIPRVHAFVERHMPEGEEGWLIMTRLAGQPLQTALENEPDPGIRHRLLRQFGLLLATIHRCPPPSALAAIEQPWLDSMLRRAADSLQRYPVDGTPALLRDLDQQRPRSIPPALIHGDYTLDNVLVAEGSVGGVIDWAGGAVGDPRYDLALATQPGSETWQTPAGLAAFYEGYGGSPLTAEEASYFVGLYEFF